MPSEQDLVITAFLRGADEPEGVSTLEAQRYWHLAGNELGRIISSLGVCPREVVDALQRRKASECAVGTEAIVEVERRSESLETL